MAVPWLRRRNILESHDCKTVPDCSRWHPCRGAMIRLVIVDRWRRCAQPPANGWQASGLRGNRRGVHRRPVCFDGLDRMAMASAFCQPGGLPAISRWSRGAPPVDDPEIPLHPGRDARFVGRDTANNPWWHVGQSTSTTYHAVTASHPPALASLPGCNCSNHDC